MSIFKNGDKVNYKECFGDKELIFIGVAKELKYGNDAVVLYDGECIPVMLSRLSRADGYHE